MTRMCLALHGTPGSARRLLRHTTAFSGAVAAGFCTRLAVVHRMLRTFLGTGFADGRAGFTDRGSEFAATCHVTGGQATYLRAINVDADATRHFFRILFLQTSRGAVIAGIRAGVAGGNAGLELFV